MVPDNISYVAIVKPPPPPLEEGLPPPPPAPQALRVTVTGSACSPENIEPATKNGVGSLANFFVTNHVS